MRRHWPAARAALLTLLVISLLAVRVLGALAEPATARPGIDLANMDLSVDPGTDFYRYANGGWLDRTTIPDDFASIETMSELDGRTRLQLLHLLTGIGAEGTLVAGSDEWKAVQLFAQGTDLATRNAQGLQPIAPILAEIDRINNQHELHRFLQDAIFLNVAGFFVVSGGPDLMDSARTSAYLSGPLLGLPTRDYYLDDEPATIAVRDAYVAAGAELLTRLGREPAAADASAIAVYELERQLALPSLSPEEAVDFTVIYHPLTVAELSDLYPAMDWTTYLNTLGLSHLSTVIVPEHRYLAALNDILTETPLTVIKDYLRLQLLFGASSQLDEATEATTFAYYGGALNGVATMAPIEGRILDHVSFYLPDALGKLYVAEHFSAEDRAASELLVQDIVAAFRNRLEANPWMTDATRANALAKLDRLHVKVGYPDQWADYAGVEIEDSFFASALSASNHLYREHLATIGKPVDRERWPFPPQTVNAMYNPMLNEIVIPAAMLQEPMFSRDADAASNFGAIGYVIGHEITHGFDQSGAQFDANGNLSNWWTREDERHFAALNAAVATQYSAIQVLDDMRVDGNLTVAENVADLGGVQVAFDALQAHRANEATHEAPPISDELLTPEQRFFVAAASLWRAETREASLRSQLLVDTHAPAQVRAVQPLRNFDAFHEAFAIEPGDPMYLAPAARIVIW